MDFATDGGAQTTPTSAFVTCAAALTEGGQTSSHAEDTRSLMTAVLLGAISQDDLTVREEGREGSTAQYPDMLTVLTVCSCRTALSTTTRRHHRRLVGLTTCL